jgi:hypothetical protein
MGPKFKDLRIFVSGSMPEIRVTGDGSNDQRYINIGQKNIALYTWE